MSATCNEYLKFVLKVKFRIRIVYIAARHVRVLFFLLIRFKLGYRRLSIAKWLKIYVPLKRNEATALEVLCLTSTRADLFNNDASS